MIIYIFIERPTQLLTSLFLFRQWYHKLVCNFVYLFYVVIKHGVFYAPVLQKCIKYLGIRFYRCKEINPSYKHVHSETDHLAMRHRMWHVNSLINPLSAHVWTNHPWSFARKWPQSHEQSFHNAQKWIYDRLRVSWETRREFIHISFLLLSTKSMKPLIDDERRDRCKPFHPNFT